MPLKTEGIDEPDLNLTPMIDIVFLLIIFFMVGTRFTEDKPTLFEIALATTNTESSVTPGPDPILISITKEGVIRVNHREVSLEELEQTLKAAKDNYEDQAVVIGGEGKADLQNVVNVLDICQKLKIKRFTLAAERPEASGS